MVETAVGQNSQERKLVLPGLRIPVRLAALTLRHLEPKGVQVRQDCTTAWRWLTPLGDPGLARPRPWLISTSARMDSQVLAPPGR